MEDSSDFHPGFTRNTVQLLRRTTRPLHSGKVALAFSAISATAVRQAVRAGLSLLWVQVSLSQSYDAIIVIAQILFVRSG